MSTSPVIKAEDYFEAKKAPTIFLPSDEKADKVKYVLQNTKIVPQTTRSFSKKSHQRGDLSVSFLNTFKNQKF